MRRIISFILVLALVLSMSCAAFAFTKSNEGSGSTGGDCTCGGDHEYTNGVCTCCGEVCDHEYVNGKCTECGKWRPLFSGDNPKTGDIILFWVAVMLISVAALGGMTVIYRKKFHR